MASPEEVSPPTPDTLPEDFGEWDNGSDPNASPNGSSEWDSVNSPKGAPKARGKSEYIDAVLASYDEAPRVWRSDAHAQVPAKPQNDWHKEGSRPAAPREGVRREVSKTATEKPRPVVKPASSSPAMNTRQETWPAAPRKGASEPADGRTSRGPEASQATQGSSTNGARNSRDVATAEMRKADEALYQFFSTETPAEAKDEAKPALNKRLIFAGAGGLVVVVLLVVMIPMLRHHETPAAASQSVQTIQVPAETAPVETSAKPSAGEPVSQNRPQASVASNNPQPTSNNTADQTAQDSAPQGLSASQTKMMNDQLAAPRTIARDATKQMAENAPPPSLGAGAEGLAGGGWMGGSVFNAHGQPVVKAGASRPLTISSGVATGMLTQRVEPVYPSIAKAARVSGTVELEATISKAGTVKDLHVVGGPAMLRQAAMDAVRQWRYKPYKLNNDPTEVETTININFTLGH